MRKPPLNPGECAEIVFFTGVRFVRLEDYIESTKNSPQRNETRRSSRPRRDRAPR